MVSRQTELLGQAQELHSQCGADLEAETVAKCSLAIAYEGDAGDWPTPRLDFVFFGLSSGGRGIADLVGPHGHHLSDALPKLRGVADFAERFASGLRRIEPVAETCGRLRVLDITKVSGHQAIRDAQSAKALYESDVSSDC